jgi:hypothetical protein
MFLALSQAFEDTGVLTKGQANLISTPDLLTAAPNPFRLKLKTRIRG